MFPFEFCEIFKNIIFAEHIRVTFILSLLFAAADLTYLSIVPKSFILLPSLREKLKTLWKHSFYFVLIVDFEQILEQVVAYSSNFQLTY